MLRSAPICVFRNLNNIRSPTRSASHARSSQITRNFRRTGKTTRCNDRGIDSHGPQQRNKAAGAGGADAIVVGATRLIILAQRILHRSPA